jgi:hypothetical protein
VSDGVGTEGQGFSDIYARLAALVTEQAAQRKLRPPPLRDPSVAHVSLLDVPRDALLAIEDDRVFVASCYLVLLDVAPTKRQMHARRRWLREGTRNREEILHQIRATKTFGRSGRRVHLT